MSEVLVKRQVIKVTRYGIVTCAAMTELKPGPVAMSVTRIKSVSP